jgi:MFS family permease
MMRKIIGRNLNIRATYNDYPRQFWLLVLGAYIDRLGRALLFPFFTLYITQKFSVGMTEVGVIFGIFSVSSMVGSMIGGALTDRFGRKGLMLFGLISSGLSSLLMGMIDAFSLFIAFSIIVGLFSNTGGPAQQAMVADILSEEKRAEGYGVLRVVINLADTMGPMVGGLLATQSYLFLFVSDAIVSAIAAGLVFMGLRETLPIKHPDETVHSTTKSLGGYVEVIRDTTYLLFLGSFMLMVLVYMQMHTTLAVYLRDLHGVTVKSFGLMMSLNAAIVVIFQVPITRWCRKFRAMMVMVVGTLLYAFGFGMYGFVSKHVFFWIAIVIITIGEMLVSPVGQAIASRLSPEEMRGRYMAAFGFSWVIPTAIGPLLAGLVMDNMNPAWVWYSAGIIAIISALSYYILMSRSKKDMKFRLGANGAA